MLAWFSSELEDYSRVYFLDSLERWTVSVLEFGESQLSEIRNFLLVWLALTIIIKRARGENQRKVLANITHHSPYVGNVINDSPQL